MIALKDVSRWRVLDNGVWLTSSFACLYAITCLPILYAAGVEAQYLYVTEIVLDFLTHVRTAVTVRHFLESEGTAIPEIIELQMRRVTSGINFTTILFRIVAMMFGGTGFLSQSRTFDGDNESWFWTIALGQGLAAPLSFAMTFHQFLPREYLDVRSTYAFSLFFYVAGMCMRMFAICLVAVPQFAPANAGPVLLAVGTVLLVQGLAKNGSSKRVDA